MPPYQPIIKLCGITTQANAHVVINAGANWLGLIFVPNTPRTVNPTELEAIFEACRFKVKVVGVFCNQPTALLQELASYLPFYALQLHGQETPEDCKALKQALPNKKLIKVFPLAVLHTPEVVTPYLPFIDYLLLDVPKGSPEEPHWDRYPVAPLHTPKKEGAWPPVLLAGKLNASNVGAVIKRFTPFGVDAASGVEQSPGVKTPELCNTFIKAVKTTCKD
jgi:phosphoribosylanthranilate isomerase